MNEQVPTIRTESAPALDFNDPGLIETLKATVAIGATDAEFALFREFCKSTGLNPFKREIWFIKPNGRVQMMTGINGFYAIANAIPEYDGIEVGFVGKGGEYLPITYPGNDFIGAWSRVYRKDRKIPTEAVAMLAEYDKKHSNWNTMKRVMICKCAESMSLRKAFPQQLNGLYTQEEMPVEFASGGAVEVVKQERKPAPTPTPPIAEAPEFLATDDAIKEGVAFQYNTKLWGDQFQNPAERNSKWNMMRVKYGLRKQGTIAYSAVAVPGWEPFVVFDPTEGADDMDHDREAAGDDDLPGEWAAQPVKTATQVEVLPADQLDAIKSRVRKNKAQQHQEG